MKAPGWHASTTAGTMLAKLFELYARSLRVKQELDARRASRLVDLVNGTRR